MTIPTQGIHLDFNGDCVQEVAVNVQQALGLDLVGGLRVVLRADAPGGSYTAQDLRETANNVGRRVNALGVSEPAIQVLGNERILVELPGVTDAQTAIDTIRQTALLEFVNFRGLNFQQIQQLEGQRILTTARPTVTQSPDGTAAAVSPLTGQPFETVMTGAMLQAAAAVLEQTQWVIQFELKPEAADIFGPYTGANIGQPMAIVLDGVVLSAPTIQAQLTTGGIITGDFDEETSRTLALQLRSGALPIPLVVETREQVGATLGQESVNLSLRAGVIGIIVVLTFMLVYYRVPGIAADLALLVFIVLNLAVFKLIPVTLTLPAIIGFLISIGTAVDGNILIFERIKEELRAGRKVEEALPAGFDRAWQSIRDSNLSTIIICAILFFFGQTPGASIVAGFAVTLALGLIINLFTAVVVTRTFLNILVALLRQPVTERKWLLGLQGAKHV
ncbi:MAG: protein translocase subunit SecD [Chloroflexota bacterium]|nr:protein translocase subunit SecD [Chloroflexota bacterium]